MTIKDVIKDVANVAKKAATILLIAGGVSIANPAITWAQTYGFSPNVNWNFKNTPPWEFDINTALKSCEGNLGRCSFESIGSNGKPIPKKIRLKLNKQLNTNQNQLVDGVYRFKKFKAR